MSFNIKLGKFTKLTIALGMVWSFIFLILIIADHLNYTIIQIDPTCLLIPLTFTAGTLTYILLISEVKKGINDNIIDYYSFKRLYAINSVIYAAILTSVILSLVVMNMSIVAGLALLITQVVSLEYSEVLFYNHSGECIEKSNMRGGVY